VFDEIPHSEKVLKRHQNRDDPCIMALNHYILTGTCLELNLLITFLNVYGPCVDKKYFWEKVAVRGHLDHQNSILVGDLNFTIDVGEAWGEKSHLDPLSTFVKGIFNDSGLLM
jgi:hypothetical protein